MRSFLACQTRNVHCPKPLHHENFCFTHHPRCLQRPDGVMCLLMPGDMGAAAIGEANAANPELLEMATMFHYGIGHAISMCGLILLMIRKSALDTAKNALLAYCIGTALLLTLFATVFSNTPVMEFSLEMAVPDILALGVALFGYFKAK